MGYPAPPDAHAQAQLTHAQAQAHETHAHEEENIGLDLLSVPLLVRPSMVLATFSAKLSTFSTILCETFSRFVATVSASWTRFGGFCA